MRKQRLLAIEMVRPDLLDNERSLETLIANGGRLMATLGEARRAAGVSAVVGQEPIRQIAEFNACLAKAWDHLVEAHKGLYATARTELGLQPTAFGPEECQPSGLDEQMVPHGGALRIVG